MGSWCMDRREYSHSLRRVLSDGDRGAKPRSGKLDSIPIHLVTCRIDTYPSSTLFSKAGEGLANEPLAAPPLQAKISEL
ncbi:hypothetical protein XA68_13354 [Ophiocordyceps unilateralis]|uniref:Uncharacterized protein n=1 Tax=Ophiocordyceps unilateralis TaxID=268505 RepID=A0A2A9PCE9_OPHUN|nr:hypothetical protein XA68_13354 [Ophiocordyceps unilateralis]